MHELERIGGRAAKDSIVVAAVCVERGSDVVDFGRIETTHQAIDKLIKKLQGISGSLHLKRSAS